MKYKDLPVDIQEDIFVLSTILVTAISRLANVTKVTKQSLMEILTSKAVERLNSMTELELQENLDALERARLKARLIVNPHPPDEASAETTNPN